MICILNLRTKLNCEYMSELMDKIYCKIKSKTYFKIFDVIYELTPIVKPPGHTGSNDTGLMSVSCPGAESIAGQTDKLLNNII